MSLRTFVFNMIVDDPQLIALGLHRDNVYAAQALDSVKPGEFTAPDIFAVVRFTSTAPGLTGARGASRPRQATCQLWVYDWDRDFDLHIAPILKRWEDLVDEQEAPAMGDGSWWIGAEYVGQSDDAFDDVYDRIARNSAYTIAYTGT